MMKEKLLGWLKKIASDTHSLIVAAILAPFLTVGSIYLFAKNLWIQLKTISLLSIPLWATIVVAFLSGLLVYVAQRRVHSYDYKRNKDFSIVIGDFKWRTYWIAGDCYGLIKTPYCKKHDLQMYRSARKFLCYGADDYGCDSSLTTRKNEEYYEKALILIEKKLRKKKLYIGT